MNLEFYKTKVSEDNPLAAAACRIAKKLLKIEEEPFFSKTVDEESKGHVVKKQLRCAVSSCFDKQNICCKECDIKKCRYKCNFIDKEVCEHQFIK